MHVLLWYNNIVNPMTTHDINITFQRRFLITWLSKPHASGLVICVYKLHKWKLIPSTSYQKSRYTFNLSYFRRTTKYNILTLLYCWKINIHISTMIWSIVVYQSASGKKLLKTRHTNSVCIVFAVISSIWYE